MNSFSPGFEEYIIFHRGIVEVKYNNEDHHLYVKYQDGKIQDLGNPYADDIISAAESVEFIKKLGLPESLDHLNELAVAMKYIIEHLSEIENLEINPETGKYHVLSMDEVRNEIGNIEGVYSKVVDGKTIYYVVEDEPITNLDPIFTYGTMPSGDSSDDDRIRDLDPVFAYEEENT